MVKPYLDANRLIELSNLIERLLAVVEAHPELKLKGVVDVNSHTHDCRELIRLCLKLTEATRQWEEAHLLAAAHYNTALNHWKKDVEFLYRILRHVPIL